MLKTFWTTAMSLSFIAAQAQFSLNGRVVDAQTKDPLVNATVQLIESHQNTLTDSQGQFTFSKIKAGPVTLRVRFVGFEEWTQTIAIDHDQTLEISMNASSLLDEEIIVRGTRAGANSPFTFTQVDAPTIQKQNFGQDLPFLLNWTPSLVTTSDAGAGIGYTGLRIRGTDATRINVTINGIPYNDSESQGTFWVDIPDVASSTESIQIQRGVGTSTNGGSAFGATVNLQTSSMQPGPYANVIVAGGWFNSQRYTARMGTGLLNNHWTFDAKVSKILSDGYVDRASSDLSSYFISGGYSGKKTMLKAITFGGHERTYQSWYGVDDWTVDTFGRTFNWAGVIYDADGNVGNYYSNQVDDYRQDHYQLHWTQQLSENWSSNISLHYTYGRGYYEEYHQDDLLASLGVPDYSIRDTIIQYMDVVVRKWLDNKFYGGTFSFHYSKDKSAITIGGAYNQYGHARHFGTIEWAEFSQTIIPQQHYYDGKSQKNDFNIYGKWNYNFTDRLNGFLDLQYRKVSYETSGTRNDQSPYAVNEDFNFFNPKVGLSYIVGSNGLLYSSIAIANREPNRNDYLDNDIKPKPEQLQNLELGWRGKFSKHFLDVNYYLMNYKDQLVLTGEIDNTGFPIRANVGRSFRTGLEAAASFNFLPSLNWNINATWAINQNQDYVTVDENNVATARNTTIVLSPAIIGGSQLSWAFKGFSANWLAKYVGAQYLDNSQNASLTLDPYLINDLRLSYGFSFKGVKEIATSVLLNNVLDAEYSSNGYVYDGTPYYYPQAGRNFMLMLSLRF